jgi:hypothetical protein
LDGLLTRVMADADVVWVFQDGARPAEIIYLSVMSESSTSNAELMPSDSARRGMGMRMAPSKRIAQNGRPDRLP